MKATLCLFLFVTASIFSQAQVLLTKYDLPRNNNDFYTAPFKRKLYERNYGATVGLERGNITALNLAAKCTGVKLLFISLPSPVRMPTLNTTSAIMYWVIK